ncbi:MAG: hypothetical protein GF350_10715, partial [Chitinivibrionales bacterium]|nr:hypothetical protein [Chitinivibrionales bacterium]
MYGAKTRYCATALTVISLFMYSTAQDSTRTNQGIYGADINQLAFDTHSGVMFAAVDASQSLFCSDDTGKTWYQGFPSDSLLYAKSSAAVGWGG